ncbi:helix-turn-helix domain-containing protein, partial [Rhodobacteraceae bacterium R_SAG10]|nr:helix-turn-helix domain-containing protein [Rhodobacteraceae bacterium R_SAG10]
ITLRLNRARQLVEQTRMSLIEIAVACGFKSQSSFAKNYKRKFGISPKSCRGHVGSRPRTAPNTALTR